MNRRRNTIILIAIVVAFVIIKWLAFLKQDDVAGRHNDHTSIRDISHLILTNHAKCRMDCRHITTDEIKEIVQSGTENQAKSGACKKGDHTYAIEGYSIGRQHIRVIVAPEDDGLVVVTCIDLDKDWPCNCD